MNFYHLKYFRDAALTGRISEAAHKNFVTQSAISQAIKSLEESLQCSLLEHRKNRFQLTEEGRVVLGECAKIFDSVSDLRNKLEQSRKGYAGNLCIGSTLSLGAAFLPRYLTHVKKNYPGLALKVRLGDQSTVKDWLHKGEIDLGLIINDRKNNSEFRTSVIGRGEYFLVRSPRFRGKAETEGIIVTRADNSEVALLKKAFKRARGINLKIAMEIVSWEAIRSLLLSGHGIGLCPDYVVREDLKSGALKRIKTGAARLSFDLITMTRKRVTPSKNTRLFLELLQSRAVT